MVKRRHRLVSLAVCAAMLLSLCPQQAVAEPSGGGYDAPTPAISAASEPDEPENSPAAVQLEGQTQTYYPDADGLPGNDELFAGYVQRTLYGGAGVSTLGSYGEALTGVNLALYQALKTQIAAVASSGGSAVFEVTLAEPITWNSSATNSDELGEEAAQALSDAGVDHGKIVDCLLADCPYELYWFDKTKGTGMKYSSSASGGVGSISSFEFTFAVAADSQSAGDAASVSTDKATAAAKAAQTAQEVVSANADKTAYEKLLAYRDYICGAVSYNDAAASDSYTGGYGDPWQLIYVFDGDADTNVVCEGYAKAFQYLCDLGGLTCYTVTGTMSGGTGAGNHMWNIVTLDGENYLVDVTNSDTGTVGAYGGLFLAGAPQGTAEGYTISIPAHDLGNGSSTTAAAITYAYDKDTAALYDASILTLATADYTEPGLEPTNVATVTIGEGDNAQVTTYSYTGNDSEAAAKALDEAFLYASENGTDSEPATITLLADMVAPEDWCFEVKSGSVILKGSEFTISGSISNSDYGLITVADGAKLTIQDGTFRNVKGKGIFQYVYTVFVKAGGHLVVENGDIFAQTEGSFDSAGVYIQNGSAEINGGTITAENLSTSANNAGYGVVVWEDDAEVTIRGGKMTGKAFGLYVYFGTAHLIGGTYTSDECAIEHISHYGASEVRSLLEPGNAYFEGESTTGTAKYGVNTTDRKLPAGTYTVGQCTNHEYGAWSDAGDGTHTCTCDYCGKTESAKHDYDATGKCQTTGCTAQAAVSVTVDGTTTHYGTMQDAWTAAKNSETAATVTLLADATVNETLTVEGNDDITLDSKTKDGENGPYTISGNVSAIICVSGGSLTLKNGNVAGRGASYFGDAPAGVQVVGGTFYMEGGSVSGYRALDITGGEIYISGGSLTGGNTMYGGYGINAAGGKIELTGGTYFGRDFAIISYDSEVRDVPVGDLLGEGCSYMQDGVWVSDTTPNGLKGTVTVVPAPIRKVTVIGQNTTVTYGYAEAEAPTLTATATLGSAAEGSVTYQWYQDGKEITGATGATYTPTALNAGDHTYTCTATAGGYSRTSGEVTVTVDPASLAGAEVTLTGTSFEYDGVERSVGVQSVTLNGTDLTWDKDYRYSDYTGKDAGTYKVTVTGTGNYTGTATADWVITPKKLTIKDYNMITVTKTYDSTTDITLDGVKVELEGIAAGDEGKVTLDASGVTAQFADANAGENKAVTLTGSFALSGDAAVTKNYTLVQPDTSGLTGSITPRPITVTPAAGQTKEYGAADPELTYQVTSGTLFDVHTLTLARAAGDAVGSYVIDQYTITDAAGNDVAGNYDVTLETVNFQITQPNLSTATVTLDQSSYTYDGTAKKPGVTVVKNGRTVAPSEYDVAYSANVNAGTATVTITAVANGNYTGTQTADFQIKKATPNLGTVSYTGTIYPSTALADVTLARADETVPGKLTLDGAANADATFGTAGTQDYGWTFTPEDSDNYEEVKGSIKLTVAEDTLTGISVSGTPAKTNYIHGDSFEMGGLTVTATYASGLTADVTGHVTVANNGVLTAGQQSVTLSYTEGNVTETCTVDGLTVDKKPLDVSGVQWNVGTYTYNGTEQGPTLSDNLPDGVEVKLDGEKATNAGNYTAKAIFTLAAGYSGDSYIITGAEGNALTAAWSIGKASPAVSVEVAAITGSGTARTVTLRAELTGAGEDIPTGTVTFTANGAAIGTAAVGADGTARYDWQADADALYTVAARYSGSDNYTEAVSEAITVNTARQPQTIVIADVGAKTYGDAPFELALAGAGSGDGDVTFTSSDPDVLSIEGSTAAIHAAGTVTITAVKAADDTHDAATATLELTIGKKTLTVTADDASMVAGGTLPELTYTVDGLADGDTFTGPALTAAGDGSTTGSYAISITGGTLTHADSYAVKYVDGTLTVSAKPLYTVTVENGTGSGSYTEGETVTVTAEERPGSTFTGWTGGAKFEDAERPTTTFVMPAHDVTVTANYTPESEEPFDPGISDEEDEVTTTHRLVKPAITDDQIPEALKEANYTTAEQIEEKLAEELRLQTDEIDAGNAQPQMQFFDVRLEFKDESGSWVKVSQENFPKQGIRVWLADLVPGVDQATHSFVVTHMLVVDMNGHFAGEVEYPALKQGERGLYFTVYSLSPIGVAWTEKPAKQPAASGSDGDVEAFIGAAVVIGGGAALLAYHYREDLPVWKLAGVVTLAAADGTEAAADASGAPVANATVTLYRDGEAVKTLTTDAHGLFETRVPKGTYEAVVTWERDGAVYTARKEVVAESVLDDGAVQQIVLQAAEG